MVFWDCIIVCVFLEVVVQPYNLFPEVRLQEEIVLQQSFRNVLFTVCSDEGQQTITLSTLFKQSFYPTQASSVSNVIKRKFLYLSITSLKLDFNETCLHWSINLGAVKHEDKVFEVPNR